MRLTGVLAVRTALERFEGSVGNRRREVRPHLTLGSTTAHPPGRPLPSLGLHPSRKYQNEGGPKPPRHRRPPVPGNAPQEAQKAIRRFLDALLWNWIIVGTDAHAKNYSLLLHGGQVRLAPFTTSRPPPYGLPLQKLRLAVKPGSAYKVDPSSSPWSRLARDIDLTEDEVKPARQLALNIPDAFTSVGREPEVRGSSAALQPPNRLGRRAGAQLPQAIGLSDQQLAIARTC